MRCTGWKPALLPWSVVGDGGLRRTGLRRIWPAIALISLSAYAAPLNTGDVRLVLENGAGSGKAMILDTAMTGGKWSPKLWGRAPGYSFAHCEGRASVDRADAKGGKLTVMLSVPTDLAAVGGKADYTLELTRAGDTLTGTYSGRFIELAVQGKVSGAIVEPVIRSDPGVQPPRSGEHPRLIFRKHEVPEMRRRLTTATGKAIESMLLVRSPLRLASQVTDRRASWMAANWAAIYQLTGDKANAKEARAVLMEESINKAMPSDRNDTHHATRLLGLALAYDMGYDAWDEDFRRYLGEFLMITAEDLAMGLHEGLPMMPGTVDPTPWKHRNAIRMSCVGVAALAVLDDPDADGEPLARAAALVDLAERHVVEYVRDGITGAGRGLEGDMYKNIALANGVLQFIHAQRTVTGRDLSRVNPFLVAGHVLESVDIAPGRCRFGLSSISIQASGRWPMGLGCVPVQFVPAMKWCFDRSVGPQGAQHFDCTYPYQAAYAVKNYPFDANAVPPGSENGLPLMVLDTAHGHCLFRNRWQDGDDIVVSIDFGALTPPGLGRAAAAGIGAVTIAGLGTNWIDGRIGLPALNSEYGGELLYAEKGRPGQAFTGARLDRVYERRSRRGWRRRRRRLVGRWNPSDPNVFPMPERSRTESTGVGCTRHFAVDYSGAAGVPALLVIVDEMRNVGKQRWLYPTSGIRRRPTIHGNPAGRNLAWHFASGKPRANSVAPTPLEDGGQSKALEGRGQNKALERGGQSKALERGGPPPQRSRCFAIVTLNNGPVPAVAFSTDGDTSRATIGAQTVIFDGKRITFAK